MAIHVIDGNGPPTSAPTENGMHYVDNLNGDHYLAVGTSSVNDWIQVGEGGGSSTFIGLDDTPVDYSASANKELSVNTDADAIIFRDRRFTDGVDTPAGYAGDGGKVVSVKTDETGLEFTTPSNGGGTGTIKQNNTVWVDTAEGDDTLDANRGNIDKPFQTIKAAADYVTTQGPTDGNDWVIQVNPGVYVEQPITIPRNTQVRGTSDFKTNVFPADETAALFTVGIFSNMANLNLDGRVGVVGAATSQAAVSSAFVAGNTFEKMLVNNFTTGFLLNGGAGTQVDCILENISIGQLGSVDLPLVVDGVVTVRAQGLFSFAESTIAYDVKNGATLSVDAGLIENASTAIKVTDAEVTVGDYKFQNVDTVLETDGQSTAVIADALADGTNADEGIKIAGTGGNIQVNDCSFVEFTNVVHILSGQPNVFINNSVFTSGGVGSRAMIIEGFPNTYVSACKFFSGSLDNTTAIEVGTEGVDFPFLDLNDSFFFNYVTALDLRTGQSTIRHSTFEVFAGPLAGTTAIKASGNSNNFVDQCSFSVGFGIQAEGTSGTRLNGTRFLNTETDIEQKDSAIIFTQQSSFNEDKLSAETWVAVRGNYNSTKGGDRALVVLDQLKVGVPEVGRASSFGEGAAHGRGLLVYEYDADTDTYTDVSEDAKVDNGNSVGIPNTSPNSALYIGSELITEEGIPFLFPAINYLTDIIADSGEGSLISEIWDGAAWISVRTMVTEADAPFRVLNSEEGTTDTQYNVRLPITVERDWETSDPVVPPIGTNYYWFRYRVQSDWFDSRWDWRAKVTIPAANVASAEELFPVYFDFAQITDTSFWANVNGDGSDIVVTRGDGVSRLPTDKVAFNTTAQTGQMYWLTSELDNAVDNEYFIYWGNAAAPPDNPLGQFGRGQVWQEYQGVWHNEDGPNNFEDATINANDAVSPNGMTQDTTRGFTNSVQAIDNNSYMQPPDSAAFTNPGDRLIYSCWVTYTGGAKRRAMDLSNNQTQTNRDSYFGILAESGGNASFDFQASNIDSGINIADGSLHHLVLTYDGTNLKGYVDGVKRIDQLQSGNITSSNFPLRFANRGNAGGTFNWPSSEILDEFRILNGVVRSEGWWQTEYSNMNDPSSFFVLTTPEQQQVAVGDSKQIDIAPTFKQLRLIPNTAKINKDGFLEYFGKARPLRSLDINVQSFLDTAGDDAAGPGQEVWYTKTFGVQSRYRLAEGAITRITTVANVSNIVDSSSDLQARIHYVPRGSGSGNLLWRIASTTSNEEATFETTQADAPQTSDNDVDNFILVPVSVNQNNKDEFIVVPITLPIRNDQQNFDSRLDLIWFTIERIGNSGLDTYTGPIDIVSIEVSATVWRDGQHTTFL